MHQFFSILTYHRNHRCIILAHHTLSMEKQRQTARRNHWYCKPCRRSNTRWNWNIKQGCRDLRVATTLVFVFGATYAWPLMECRVVYCISLYIVLSPCSMHNKRNPSWGGTAPATYAVCVHYYGQEHWFVAITAAASLQPPVFPLPLLLNIVILSSSILAICWMTKRLCIQGRHIDTCLNRSLRRQFD